MQVSKKSKSVSQPHPRWGQAKSHNAPKSSPSRPPRLHWPSMGRNDAKPSFSTLIQHLALRALRQAYKPRSEGQPRGARIRDIFILGAAQRRVTAQEACAIPNCWLWLYPRKLKSSSAYPSGLCWPHTNRSGTKPSQILPPVKPSQSG